MRTRLIGLIAAIAGLAACMIGAAPQAAALTKPGRASDFNGDGWLDLAIGAPYAQVGGKRAGAVVVVYSTNGRIDLSRKQRIDQSLSWVPGVPGDAARFGTDLIPADYNGDGYSDLAVCTPDDSSNGQTVTYLFGSASGLARARNGNFWAADCGSWAAADFNRDGYADLVMPWRQPAGYGGLVVVEGSADFATTESRYIAGAATGVYAGEPAVGSINGDGYFDLVFPNVDADGRWKLHVFAGGPTGIKGRLVQGVSSDRADEVAVGDLDGDGYGDIATSYPGGPVACCAGAGRVRVWYGSAAGIDVARGQTLIHQNTAGIPDALERGDHFGTDIAMADTNADGRAELAIGVGDEGLGTSRPFGGLVTVIYGGSAGLNFGHVVLFHQDTAGLPGVAEAYDRFGSQLAFRDFNRDARAELVISSPSEDGGNGAVHVLRAILSSGLTGDGAVMAGPGTLGLSRLAGIGETLDG